MIEINKYHVFLSNINIIIYINVIFKDMGYKET